MKKLTIASLAAMALTALWQEEAKAWFNFVAGGSFNTNISWGGRNVCRREAEPWPCTYGLPAFNNYGPACGVPSFPVNGYGMSVYGPGGPGRGPGGAPGAPGGYQQIPPPKPGSGSAPGSGGGAAPSGTNNSTQPAGYGYGYGYAGYGYNFPYAQPVAYQYGGYPYNNYWNGR